uniref:Uncharacterized protein n=1 Tax=Aegilops tauschii subsp. strangulata TaxID=200361 RepID=A0A453SJ23_AEGTS
RQTGLAHEAYLRVSPRTGRGERPIGGALTSSHTRPKKRAILTDQRSPVISPLRRPPPPLDPFPNQRIHCSSSRAERRRPLARDGGCRPPPPTLNLPSPHLAGHRPRTVHARLLSTSLRTSLAVSVSCRSHFTIDSRPT